MPDKMRTTANLQFQVCFYPFLDGGIYINLNPGMRMLRVSLGVIDFRVWLDIRRLSVAQAETQPESVNGKLTYIQTVPPIVQELTDGIRFVAESGNHCFYVVYAAWESKPSGLDEAEFAAMMLSLVEVKGER